MRGYQYTVYEGRRPLKGVLFLIWTAAVFGSSALGNTPASILPVVAAIILTVTLVWWRRAEEREAAEDQWRREQILARYQAEMAAAIAQSWQRTGR